MKKTTLVAGFLFAIPFIYSQATIPTSGGEASGTGGSSSYSIGQLITTTTINSNGSVSAGVQQAFEISVTLGIDDTTINLTFAAYPNPTVDVLHLSISNFNQENLSYQLFNVQGQLLATKKVNNATTTIGMQSYAPAIYFLKVTSNNQAIKTFKIIKN
jgi:hypothetical protein